MTSNSHYRSTPRQTRVGSFVRRRKGLQVRWPNAEMALVEMENITESLLSTTNPNGRSKAFFFLRFGFSADSWHIFVEALKLQGGTQGGVRTVEPPTVRAAT